MSSVISPPGGGSPATLPAEAGALLDGLRPSLWADNAWVLAPVVPLYHYTSWKGVEGILQSGRIRLVTIFRQSDTREILHGLRLLAQFVDDAIDRRSTGEKVFARMFRGALKLDAMDVASSRLSEVGWLFLFCTSIKCRTSRMWREFAQEGAGVCLQFNHKLGIRFANTPGVTTPNSSNGRSLPLRVRYSPKVALRDLKHAAATALDTVRRGLRICEPDEESARYLLETTSNELAALGITLSCSLKQAGYSHEDEWRLLRVVSIQHRPVGLTLDHKKRACVEWDLRKPHRQRRLLEKVILGPKAPRGARNRARRMLNSAGFRHVKVVGWPGRRHPTVAP